MTRPTKEEIKKLKTLHVKSIMQQINTYGYDIILFDDEADEKPYVYTVDSQTTHIPVVWHAGIDSGTFFELGHDLARIEFASEEAKRQVRKLYPSHENFVTWAWYN